MSLHLSAETQPVFYKPLLASSQILFQDRRRSILNRTQTYARERIVLEGRESIVRQQVLFVQGGGGEGVHDEWDNRLVQSLHSELGSDYEIRYPRMPHEANPKYAEWKAALKNELAKCVEGVLLVGHSIGATILINMLAKDPPKLALGGIFLIATPFVGSGGWPSDDIEPLSDLGARLHRQSPIYLYHGDEDETAPLRHVDLYARAIPHAIVRRLSGRDHQLNNDMSEVAVDIQRVVSKTPASTSRRKT